MTKSREKTLTEKLADSHYQPTREEMEREYDMPCADMEDLRSAFFNPRMAGRPKPEQKRSGNGV